MPVPTLDPTKASTLTSIRVRFCETDLMGIVHHATYLAYFEAGRVEWLRRRGVTYTSWTERNIHLPVVEAHVRYRATAKFDDVLVVETTLADLRWASLRFSYAIRRGETLVAEGDTRLACVDGGHGLIRIPADVLPILAGGELFSHSADQTV